MKISDFEVILYGGSGTENGSYRYRVLNLKEQLDYAGIKSKIVTNLNSVTKMANGVKKLLILHRVAWDSEISSVVKFAKKNSIPLVYDIDDYVFDPKINKLVRGVEVLSDEQKKEYSLSVERYRRALLSCDFAMTSTAFLKEVIEKEGIPSFVHRNALSNEQTEISEKIKDKSNKSNEIIIGYFSGTHTHNYDFLECSEAIMEILEEFKNVKLLIVGPLDLPDNFRKFSNQIIRKELVPWRKLPNLLAGIDINLAPLEMNNPFCEAKSELKFFEAGIVKVPTIASPNESFRNLIRNYENGFLASNKSEWLRFLKEIIENGELRKKIADKSLKETYEKYTLKSRKNEIKSLLDKVWESYTTQNTNITNNHLLGIQERKPLKISWVTDTPEPGQGGFRVITRNCRYLSKFGHDITIYVDPGSKFSSDEEIKKFIEKHYGEVNYTVKMGHVFAQCDILIATFWTTAYNVYNFKHAKKKVYFVQDFEPYFYPMGTEYVLSERTYTLGLNHITVFPWLPPFLKKKYNAHADYFLPPINRKTYRRKNKDENKTIRILFYARPDQPRRCYDLGIQALSLVSEKEKDVEIVTFGYDKLDGSKIPFKHTNKKSLPTLDDLADLYNSADMGIVFSTTNPSLMSFEMMACGCPVIDLDIESNRYNYGAKENAALCKPTASDIAKKIIELIHNKKERLILSENGFTYSQKFPDEEGSAKKVEELLYNIYSGSTSFTGSIDEAEPMVDFINVTNELNIGEITSGKKVRQSFVPELDNLNEISLYFATYARTNDCNLIILLQNNSFKELARTEINANKIKDNSWVKLQFPVIKNSKDQILYLNIFSQDAKPGNAVTIYASRKKEGGFEKLYINDQIQNSTLCFQTRCNVKDSEIMEEDSQMDYEQKTTDELLEVFSNKMSQNKSKQKFLLNEVSSLESSVSKLDSKLEGVEMDMTTLTDSYISTKNQLNKLDGTIYKFSQTFPINIGIKILKKLGKKD